MHTRHHHQYHNELLVRRLRALASTTERAPVAIISPTQLRLSYTSAALHPCTASAITSSTLGHHYGCCPPQLLHRYHSRAPQQPTTPQEPCHCGCPLAPWGMEKQTANKAEERCIHKGREKRHHVESRSLTEALLLLTTAHKNNKLDLSGQSNGACACWTAVWGYLNQQKHRAYFLFSHHPINAATSTLPIPLTCCETQSAPPSSLSPSLCLCRDSLGHHSALALRTDHRLVCSHRQVLSWTGQTGS